jgi:hypothetical protein
MSKQLAHLLHTYPHTYPARRICYHFGLFCSVIVAVSSNVLSKLDQKSLENFEDKPLCWHQRHDALETRLATFPETEWRVPFDPAGNAYHLLSCRAFLAALERGCGVISNVI